MLPRYATQVGDPELLALQPPGLAKHLSPVGGRLDGDLDAIEVNPARFAPRLVALGWLGAGGDLAQALASAVHQRLAVRRHLKIVDALGKTLLLPSSEAVGLEDALGLRRIDWRGFVSHPLKGEAGEGDAFCGPADAPVSPL